MATANPPPAAGPPPVSTYRDRYQQQMSDAFQSNSYFGLVDGIKAAEAGRAPNPGISRIVGNVTPGWEKIAAFLLMQPSKDVVQAILDNTLPSRALNDLKRAVRTVARTTALSTAQGDPVIYINWLADQNGRGLTIAEFVEFLDALEVSCRGHKVSPSRQGSSITIRAGVQAVYAAQTGGRDQLVTLGLSGNSANLRAAAMLFLNQNRNTVLPRATSQQNNEIMLRAEVRWAIDFKKRAEHHSKLTANSPLLFRVATCVLQHLFPTRGFKMHQFAVFNITDPNEAAVGESILSHLAASYVGYGGFNLSQAGVQTSSAWNSTLNWRLVTEQAVNNGYFNHFQTNSNALRIHLEARKEKNRKALEWHRTHAAFLAEKQKTDAALGALATKNQELKGAIFDTQLKLDELRRAREEAERLAARKAAGIKAIRDLYTGLAMLPLREGDDGGEGPSTA